MVFCIPKQRFLRLAQNDENEIIFPDNLRRTFFGYVKELWPNYGLGGGTAGTGRGGKRKAAVVLVLLAKDVVSLQINTEIGKS